jgi:hypothetical protein
MATSSKPKKYKFEFDPWKEAKGKEKEAQSWANGKTKVIKPIKFDVTPSKALDERKWPEKKVLDEAYYGKPKMALIMFVAAVAQLKDDKRVEDKKKGKELESLYDGLCKDMKGAVEDWLEEVASGKADNAKALKDGKAAMGKIKDVDFKKAFDSKPADCVKALKDVVKNGKVDEKKAKEAKKALEEILSQMEKDGKDAYDAIKFLLDTARKTEKDKNTAESLQKFSKEIRDDHAGTFDKFTEGVEEFEEGVGLAVEALEGEGDPEEIAKAIKWFEGFKGLDAAGKCGEIAKKLQPKFKDIEKELK